MEDLEQQQHLLEEQDKSEQLLRCIPYTGNTPSNACMLVA